MIASWVVLLVVGTTGGDVEAGVKVEPFGEIDGQPVHLFTLTNENGLVATITDYGGIVTSLEVPDRDGNRANVVLGFDDLDAYLAGHPFFGATVGRYANRIAGGEFRLGNRAYTLARNNGPNHLHGGLKGFDKKVWNAKPFETEDAVGVAFATFSPDGEEGYPGNLVVDVTYRLTNENELRIEYAALSDARTVVNLTHHGYFDLAGAGGGDILDHVLRIDADRYTPVDDTAIPTGELAPVEGTPFDFRKPTPIGKRIGQVPGGYDHNYVLDGPAGELREVAEVYEPTSGRTMTVSTTEPGMQLYTGNFLDGSLTGLGGRYDKHAGFCLETQKFPNTPNEPKFPSAEIGPGEPYTQTTIYRFGTR